MRFSLPGFLKRPTGIALCPLKGPSEYDNCWAVEGERFDAAQFFRLLPAHLPEGTTLFIEGAPTEPDIIECYTRHAEPGEFLAEIGTICQVSSKYRCRFSAALCTELAQLAKAHAEHELLYHLHVFQGSRFLLVWHDAFFNPFLLSSVLPENRVLEFARALGATYTR